MKSAGRVATGRAARRSPVPEGLAKKTISMPRSTAAAVEELAASEGISVSAWMTRAADEAAAQQRRRAEALAATRDLLEEYEAEHGPVSDEAWQRADMFLARLERAADSAEAG